MSGILSPINVGKLIIGDTYAAAADVTALSALAVKQIQLFGANGAANAAGQDFKVYGVDNSTTGVAISDKIPVGSVKSVSAFSHVAESVTSKKVVFNAAIRSNATYNVTIKKYDFLQSPENFRDIKGFAVTGPSTSRTIADVIAEIVLGLNTALERENGGKEFTITSDATSITIEGKVQAYVQGKDSGEVVEFDLLGSIKDTAGNLFNTELTFSTIAEGNSGVGTLKQVSIMEYFFRGYETADYGREVGYPNDFTQNYLAGLAPAYNTVAIEFYHDRNRVNIERSPKMLFCAVDETYTAPVAEVSTIEVTAACTSAGTATVVIDGVSVDLPLTADTIAVNAGEIAAAIDALSLYSAVSDGVDTVTVTALVKEDQTNIASYAAGTATTSAATLATPIAGVDEAMVYTETNKLLAAIRLATGLTTGQLPDLA